MSVPSDSPRDGAPAEASSTPATHRDGTSAAEPRHFRRMLVVWAAISVVGDLLFWFLAGPHMPPGAMTSAAGGDQFDFNILFICAFPVIIAVWLYMGYCLYHWRASRLAGPAYHGPHARGHVGLEAGWISITSAIVFGLFIFGTVELVVPSGAGGGEGPQPIWNPKEKVVLPVQVIGQQWKWTYRYPTLGGFETDTLYLPVDTTIAFHVTSLDVIHDFWAYQLGVKADANPQQDNVAYTTTQHLGTFVVRCDELCGLWHGAMFNYGHILTKAAFTSWATHTRAALASNTKYLPPFAWTYAPDANGADGGYYPDSHDPYSKIQIYGAQKVTSYGS